MALLACARIGAAHSVVFGGFSADSLADRINDAECKVLITADGGWRRGKPGLLKPTADVAVANSPDHRARGGRGPHRVVGRRRADRHDRGPRPLVPRPHGRRPMPHCPPEPMDSEDLLFLLYTSGTTGKPKGIMHTTGGYLTQAAFTHKYVFDLHPETDVYWCTADVGWVTGHSYIVYGPLANGATSVMYEGTPDTPGKDRFWDLVEKYGVTILYTAPTAIRTFMKWGDQEPEKHDLSSLRLLGSVGEPINPEAWIWYHEHIGGGRCPIVDTWWQTETGAIMISPLPGRHHHQARLGHLPAAGHRRRAGRRGRRTRSSGAAATSRSPGRGRRCSAASGATRSATRTPTGASYPGRYFAGDGAKLDDDGYLWVLGRVDDVMNVSGHRISTTEVESALVDNPKVAEAAVVGAKDDTTGQAIVAFVTLRGTRHGQPRDGRGAAPARGHQDRRHQPAQADHLHRRPAQDPLRQDHAPPAARRGRGPRAGRHHHARRPRRGRGDPQPGRQPTPRTTERPPAGLVRGWSGPPERPTPHRRCQLLGNTSGRDELGVDRARRRIERVAWWPDGEAFGGALDGLPRLPAGQADGLVDAGVHEEVEQLLDAERDDVAEGPPLDPGGIEPTARAAWRGRSSGAGPPPGGGTG